MKTRPYQRTWTVALILMLTLSLCMPHSLAEEAASATPQDDFYAYVNAEWLAQAEIRPDRSSVSSFSEASDKVLDTLMADFDAMMESGEETGDPLLDMFLTYYAQVKDHDVRNADGFAPAADNYARIENLQSLDDLSAQAKEWILSSMPLPFSLGVSQDLLDVTQYTVHASMARAFIGDPSYYEPDNQIGQIVIPLLKDMQTQLFVAAGATEEEAQAEVERAFAFDALLVGKTPTIVEQNDSARLSNPTDIDDFAKMSEHIDLAALATSLVDAPVENVNLTNKEFFAAFDGIYAPEHFEDMKSWMKVQFLSGVSSLLSDDFSDPADTFNMLLSGAQEVTDPDESDYGDAYGMFDDVIGLYYGEKYFGEDAKADVTDIVENAIDVYRVRLQGKDWLGDDTKAMAIRKLDEMSIRVGYPDKLPTYYDLYEIVPTEEGGTLYGNTMALIKAIRQDAYSKYGTVPDRTEWITTGDTVNAFYNPSDNSINFPAGILQAPFYSPNQSESANLGGIGMIIGHEISHAFDNNGALFDEVGNMQNWWTEEDFAEFEARSEAMVALFDGIPFAGSTVNGELTLGENIADAGGISCMLDIVQSLPDVSLQDFFEAYAATWRNRMTPEVEALNLSDTHSPPVLRVNIQCGNSDAFYEAYEIDTSDAMYIAPEDRVNIW